MTPMTPSLRVLSTITTLFALLQVALSNPTIQGQTEPRTETAALLDFGSIWRSRSQQPAQSLNKRSPLEELSGRDSFDTNSNGTKFLWLLEDTYAGKTFFDRMTFFEDHDPTHGLVTYVSREQALSRNLTYIEEDGTVVMQADSVTSLPYGVNRTSVRIETTKNYTSGLFILDVKRAPWGCGVWPAFWTTNKNWPTDGEIDIIEGVHDNEHNQVTWHTDPGCFLDANQVYTGTPVDKPQPNGTINCDHNLNHNAGCGVTEWSRASYGPDFESQGGGVIAMKWDENGIAVWSFFRAAIPQDLAVGTPNPSTWDKPSAILTPKYCHLTRFFKEHVVIFDITFCGDWAGNSYATTKCPGTCAERLMEPSNFVTATWHINSLKVFKKLQIYATIPSGALPIEASRWGLKFVLILFTMFVACFPSVV